MPITFKSRHAPDILMLETVGLGLLRLLGHSGTVPGALAAEDIPAALATLRRAVAEAPGRVLEQRDDAGADEDGRDDSRAIGVAQRAAPLIAMLETALREGEYVMWER